jgi:hypothetical protein
VISQRLGWFNVERKMPEERYYNPLDCRTRSAAITAFVVVYLLFATVQPSGGLPPVIKIGKFYCLRPLVCRKQKN